MSHANAAMMRCHFESVASKYNGLRVVDLQPVQFLVELLQPIPAMVATDIGCGAGAYDALLLNCMDGRMFLHCVDSSEHMLRELKRYLTHQRLRSFEAVLGQADSLPLAGKSQDAILSFNAIHHFPLKSSLEEAWRVMKPGAYLLIYTRFRSQNKRTVWGRYFPHFADKENRLFDGDELSVAIGRVNGLTVENVVTFFHRRESSLERLLEQATNYHYSTFRLYSDQELQSALEQFEWNLRRRFGKDGHVSWHAENSLVIARKR